MERPKNTPPRQAQREGKVPREGQHVLDIRMFLVKPGAPAAGADDEATPAKPVMQQMQH
jgi:hypothetical protein